MAKKKTVASKKPATAKKKSTTAKKKPTAASKKPTVAKTMAKLDKDSAALAQEIQPTDAVHETHVELLPPKYMDSITSQIRTLMQEFQEFSENNMTPTQRRRMIGAGIRNYGFIEKVADLAAANPRFAAFFDYNDLRNAIQNVDMCRDLVLLLQGFARAVSNTMLVYSDDAFTMSLIFYNSVREMARRGDPKAIELFNTLRPFFRRRRAATEQPTTKELEKDIHSLLHGKKEGKIVIENVAPLVTGGGKKVVDDVHKSELMIKESAEAKIIN